MFVILTPLFLVRQR